MSCWDADHRGISRDILDDNGTGANFYILTERDRTKDKGICSYEYASFDGGVAFAFVFPSASQSTPMKKDHIISDFGSLADHDAHPMIDEDALADGRAGMDFYPGKKTGYL